MLRWEWLVLFVRMKLYSPKIYKTYRSVRFVEASLLLLVFLLLFLFIRYPGAIGNTVILFIWLGIMLRQLDLTALEEVRVGKNEVSAWYRDGKSVIVIRENEAHFTEYGDCIVIAYRSFDRAQSLRIARWKFEPEVWQALLEEIRQVLRDDSP